MGKETGLPVVLVAVETHLVDNSVPRGVRQAEFGCPILPLYRFMLPPWKKPEN
jgi:hypothetical protein